MRAVRERIGSADALAELKAKIRAAQSFNEGVNMAQALRRTVNIHRTPIAKNIGRIKDSFLCTMFSAMAVAGLQNFCPDVLGSSDSLYNRVRLHFMNLFFAALNNLTGSPDGRSPVIPSSRYRLGLRASEGRP
jgi:hypothetical protein